MIALEGVISWDCWNTKVL